MEQQNNKIIIEAFFKLILNECQLERLPEFISESYIEHGTMNEKNQGIKGVQKHIEAFYTAFNYSTFILKDITSQGDKVTARWTFKGKHTGNFLGQPGSGKEISANGEDVYRLKDGKIQEHWHSLDLASLQN